MAQTHRYSYRHVYSHGYDYSYSYDIGLGLGLGLGASLHGTTRVTALVRGLGVRGMSKFDLGVANA